MRSIDAGKIKWSKAGLIVATAFAVFLPYYAKTALHTTADKSKLVTTETLLGGGVLVICLLGLFGLLRRKRTLLAFSFFITGFSFTLMFAPLGFAFIVLGGWLMLRSYRIQTYGTPTPSWPSGKRRHALFDGSASSPSRLDRQTRTFRRLPRVGRYSPGNRARSLTWRTPSCL
jgi:hypothetical protein